MIKATVWLWLHTRLAQVSMTHRNRTASYVLCGIKGKCKGPSKLTDTEKGKLSQLDMVLYKTFPAMCSDGNPVNGPPIISKTKSYLCSQSTGAEQKNRL